MHLPLPYLVADQPVSSQYTPDSFYYTVSIAMKCMLSIAFWGVLLVNTSVAQYPLPPVTDCSEATYADSTSQTLHQHYINDSS
jgi:hypothetical protein